MACDRGPFRVTYPKREKNKQLSRAHKFLQRFIRSDLTLYGKIVRTQVGITAQDINAGLSGYLDLPGQKGVVVRMVESQDPA